MEMASPENPQENHKPLQCDDNDGSIETPILEDWEIQRNQWKSEGDDAFQKGDYASAVQHYTSALSLDPSHHVLLSNRSAAYLGNHEKSKALADARKCIEVNPQFAKGYTRCARAMFGLGRFREAQGMYRKVLEEIDPQNAAALSGVEECQARIQAVAVWEKQQAERLWKEQKEREQQQNEEKEGEGKGKGKQSTGKSVDDEEDDDIDDFFSEIETAVEETKVKKPQQSSVADKSDLGLPTLPELPASPIDHILQANYLWLNLNPFHVLCIPPVVATSPQLTMDLISTRYRSISLRVHPDKNLDNRDRATQAFDELKAAMDVMRDDDRRKYVIEMIRTGLKNAAKQKKKKEEDQGAWEEKCVKKLFAEAERKRRDVEQRKRNHEKRERSQEDEEERKEQEEKEFDKKWRDGHRVDKRIGNWRDFQKTSNYTSTLNKKPKR